MSSMAAVRGARLPAKRSRKSLGASCDLGGGLLELPLVEELSSASEDRSRLRLAGVT